MRWQGLIPRGRLVVAVTDQLVGGQQAATLRQASRLLRLADEHGLAAVLTNQVRMAERRQAMTCDVLDSARRLMALDSRAIDRRNAEGWLKPGELMHPIAEAVSRASGRTDDGRQLWAQTIELAAECGLDPVAFCKRQRSLEREKRLPVNQLGLARCVGIADAGCQLCIEPEQQSMCSAITLSLQGNVA